MNHRANRLRIHEVHLSAEGMYHGQLALRPMTENDWDLLLKWNQDPEILFYSDGGDSGSKSLDEVQHI